MKNELQKLSTKLVDRLLSDSGYDYNMSFNEGKFGYDILDIVVDVDAKKVFLDREYEKNTRDLLRDFYQKINNATKFLKTKDKRIIFTTETHFFDNGFYEELENLFKDTYKEVAIELFGDVMNDEELQAFDDIEIDMSINLDYMEEETDLYLYITLPSSLENYLNHNEVESRIKRMFDFDGNILTLITYKK